MQKNINGKASQHNPHLRSALRYAEREWPIFPLWDRAGDECGCGNPDCKSPGKHPIPRFAPNGFKNATTDQKVIADWWHQYPDAGIGLVTGSASGVVVIDIDMKRDRDGTIALGELEAKLGPLPDTRTAVTPSKGQHRYFGYAEGIRCSTDKLGLGVDVKSDGGYIVAPPSHGLYKWRLNERGKTPKIATLPDAWIAHLSKLSGSSGTNKSAHQSNTTKASIEEVVAAFRVIPNGAEVSRDQWVTLGMAAHAATGGSDEGFRAFEEWSRRHPRYDAANTRKAWKGFKPKGIGAGTLVWHANRAKAIIKIKKLMALAKGKANLNESLQASAFAQKLLEKYQLTMADVDGSPVSAGDGSDADDSDWPAPTGTDLDDINAEAEAAEEIIESDDVLDMFVRDFRKKVAGERAIAKLLYLVATSRLFDDCMHAAIKGASSIGKSLLRREVLSFFPPEDVISFTALSEKALFYFPGQFSHKVLSMAEAAAPGEEQKFQDMLLRELMSEHILRYPVVQKVNGTLVTTNVEKRGPVAFVVTTTRNRLNPENETRMLSLEVDDSEKQTKRVMRKVARVEGLHKDAPINFAAWRAFQRWLRDGERRVVVPFAPVLADLIPPKAVRLRRDIGQLLRAIKAHALLHRHARKRDAEGRIVAEIKDYAKVSKLMADLMAEASEVKMRKTIAETVVVVKEFQPVNTETEGVSVRRVMEQLKLDRTVTWRRLRAAEDAGFVRQFGDA